MNTEHLVGVPDWTGQALPLHCSANGKVLLAFGAASPPATLGRRTATTITDPAVLRAQLEVVRRRGYATAVEELELGLLAAAAPVFDASGECVAAVSVSGPAYRLGRRRLDLAGRLCVEAGQEISARLGFRSAA